MIIQAVFKDQHYLDKNSEPEKNKGHAITASVMKKKKKKSESQVYKPPKVRKLLKLSLNHLCELANKA